MRKWLIAEKTYEGFPLFLRRPDGLDVDLLRPALPNLAIVKHKFTKRKPNGLPDDDYNHGLAEMDHVLVSAFDVDQMGVPALVETFGGERNYYFYVASDADVTETISKIASRYPAEQISWSVRPDRDWAFIETYAREHF
jgi:hypothetical protein